MYDFMHLIHIYSILIYGGFLFIDNLFLSKMGDSLSVDETLKAREAIMIHVRKVVPYSLFVVIGSGLYMFSQVFGKIDSNGLSHFQMLLSLKAFLGLWLGVRGFNQKVFGINPLVFKSHTFPFYTVIIIILLSQLMFKL